MNMPALGSVFSDSSIGPINNRLRVANLPRIAASRKLRPHSSGTVGASGRPIANRPQVANLPHKSELPQQAGISWHGNRLTSELLK